MKAILVKNTFLTKEEQLAFPVEEVLSGEYPWMGSVVVIDYNDYESVSEEDALELAFGTSSVIRLDENNKAYIPVPTF